jgi:hypothetical protein
MIDAPLDRTSAAAPDVPGFARRRPAEPGEPPRGPFSGLFHGVHVLPPFPSSGDRGFAPLTYERVDPRFGTWADLERIAADHDLLLDVMINHISRESPEFQDFQRLGRKSRTPTCS